MSVNFFIKESVYLIRKFTSKDLDSKYINWFNNKRNFIFSRHKKKNYNIKDLRNYLNNHNKRDSFFLACINKKTGIKFGTATVYLNEKNLTANIGILIGEKNYLKKGNGKKIIKLITKYIFDKTVMTKIKIGTNIKNKPMIAICKSLKMNRVSTVRSKNSTYVHYSLLKNKKKKQILWNNIE
jgi:RimJ/RimL family protein N-acetyltransferase